MGQLNGNLGYNRLLSEYFSRQSALHASTFFQIADFRPNFQLEPLFTKHVKMLIDSLNPKFSMPKDLPFNMADIKNHKKGAKK